MSGPGIAVALAFLLAATACSTTAEPTAAVACPNQPINALGIGTPCTQALDCEDLAAVSCPVANKANDLPFCTNYCKGASDLACGDKASCIARGPGVWACVPTVCAATWTIANPPGVVLPCAATVADNSGLGQGCSTPGDCPAGKAQYCSLQHDPKGGLALCTWPCSTDKDCGQAGFCYERAVGSGVSAYCVPKACQAP